MSNKKLILCKFIFFIGMCVLYSCSWQGLELYFYGKITTEDFDTIRCVTMLPVFWKLTNYFATSFIQKIHIIPLPGQEREFSHKRLEVFATRCASYLGIWALLEVMFFKSYKHQIVELIMLFVFGGLVVVVGCGFLFVLGLVWSIFVGVVASDSMADLFIVSMKSCYSF